MVADGGNCLRSGAGGIVPQRRIGVAGFGKLSGGVEEEAEEALRRNSLQGVGVEVAS